jgi:hypothetical protein
MAVNDREGIWPPYEAFYIEAMAFCTTTALHAEDRVSKHLELGATFVPESPDWNSSAFAIVGGVQLIAQQAAALSRYFWPSREREPHLSRAAHLRETLEVSDDSALKDRDLRNHLEHFDERLDQVASSGIVGVILPTYVGPRQDEPQIPTTLFRAYYTDTGEFEVLGHRFSMQPIIDEIAQLDA